MRNRKLKDAGPQVRIDVYMDDELSRKLRHLSIDSARSLTDLIGEAVRDLIAKHRNPETPA